MLRLVSFQLDEWFDRASTVSDSTELAEVSAEPLTTPRKTVREPHRPEEDRGIEGPNLPTCLVARVVIECSEEVGTNSWNGTSNS